MTATRNGQRSRTPAVIDALEVLPRGVAALEAARVGNEIRDLLSKSRDDPKNGWKHISDARALAPIGEFFTSYVYMFERNP